MTTDRNDSGPPARPGTSHPDELMGNISKSTMLKTLPVSLAAHVVVIVLTSVGFMAECVKYNTLYPAEKKARIAKAEEAREDAAEKAEYVRKLAEKAKGTGAATRPAAKPKSPVERRISGVITTQPEATIDLGEDLD